MFQRVIVTPPINFHGRTELVAITRLFQGILLANQLSSSCQSKILGKPLNTSGFFLLCDHTKQDQTNNDQKQDANDDAGKVCSWIFGIVFSADLLDAPIIREFSGAKFGAKQVGIAIHILETMVFIGLLNALDVVNFQVDNDAHISLYQEVGIESIARVRVVCRNCCGVVLNNPSGPVVVPLDLEAGSQGHCKVSLKPLLLLLVKLLDGQGQDDVEFSGNDFMTFGRWFTIKTIPSAGGIVTFGVTMSVSVDGTAMPIVVWIALQSHTAVAILTIKQAFFGVTSFVTNVVLKYVPTRFISGGGVTMFPWVDTFTAIVSIISTKVSVTFFITSIIASLTFTVIFDTFLFFFGDVESEATVKYVNSSWTGLVVDIAVLTTPFQLA